MVVLSTFLASCQTTPDSAKGELVRWMQEEGYATERVPEVEVVRIPWDRAYYSPDTDMIYVSWHWQGTDIEKAMLLHELVHANQDHPGECEVLEAEAYEASGKWLESRGHATHKNHVAIGVVTSCDPMNWMKKNELMKDG